MRKIELRKITYAAALSEETSAYTGQVWVDGVHVCDVSNSGHGGCDMVRPAKGMTHAHIEELEAYIKATRPPEDTGLKLNGAPFMRQPDLESICGDLLQDHLHSKDLKRLIGRTVAFFDPASKGVQFYKGKVPDAQRPGLIARTLREFPAAKILNELPFDEALAIYKTSNKAA